MVRRVDVTCGGRRGVTSHNCMYTAVCTLTLAGSVVPKAGVDHLKYVIRHFYEFTKIKLVKTLR